MEDVVIIGAGIAGLSLARALRASGVAATVLEAGPVAGGRIASVQAGGYLLERGPAGFVDDAPEVRALIDGLALGPRVLRSSELVRRRFIALDGRLVPAPTSPLDFARSALLPPWARARALLDLVLPTGPAARGEDETAGALVRRRLGQLVAERLVAPFASGQFGGDLDALSAASTFPSLVAFERERGSLIAGALAKWRTDRRAPPALGTHMTFAGGMQELTDALAKDLGPALRLGVRVEALAREGSRWRVTLSEGGAARELVASSVVLTQPAFAAAPLVAPLDPPLSRALCAIPYSPVAVLHLAWRRGDVPHPLDGYGFLAPLDSALRTMGVVFTSQVYASRAPQGMALFLARFGGARRPEDAALPDDALVALARADLKATLGIAAPPVLARVFRWERGLAQYTVGHRERVAEVDAAERRWAGLYFAGNGYRGLALTECIKDAARLAPRIAARL